MAVWSEQAVFDEGTDSLTGILYLDGPGESAIIKYLNTAPRIPSPKVPYNLETVELRIWAEHESDGEGGLNYYDMVVRVRLYKVDDDFQPTGDLLASGTFTIPAIEGIVEDWYEIDMSPVIKPDEDSTYGLVIDCESVAVSPYHTTSPLHDLFYVRVQSGANGSTGEHGKRSSLDGDFNLNYGDVFHRISGTISPSLAPTLTEPADNDKLNIGALLPEYWEHEYFFRWENNESGDQPQINRLRLEYENPIFDMDEAAIELSVDGWIEEREALSTLVSIYEGGNSYVNWLVYGENPAGDGDESEARTLELVSEGLSGSATQETSGEVRFADWPWGPQPSDGATVDGFWLSGLSWFFNHRGRELKTEVYFGLEGALSLVATLEHNVVSSMADDDWLFNWNGNMHQGYISGDETFQWQLAFYTRDENSTEWKLLNIGPLWDFNLNVGQAINPTPIDADTDVPIRFSPQWESDGSVSFWDVWYGQSS